MYLIETGDFPFTAEQLRAAIGLKSDKMDLILAAGIASMCCMSVKAVRTETWLVAEGKDVSSVGRNWTMDTAVTKVDRDPRNFFRCTFEPDPEAVEKAWVRCQRWALNQDDVRSALGEEQGHDPMLFAGYSRAK